MLDLTDLIISDSDDDALVATPETIRKMAEAFERAKRGVHIGEANMQEMKMENKQKTCQIIAAYRYTWAGQDESFVCIVHGAKLEAIAHAIGYYVQLIPIELNEEIKCSQTI